MVRLVAATAALYLAACALTRMRHRRGNVAPPPGYHTRLYTLMATVDRVFGAHGIPYWIESGTRLGAVRHRGVIPWDDDIDLAVPEACDSRLDGLFLRLQQAPGPGEAQRIEGQIWQIWGQSDDGAVRGLMRDGVAAMQRGDYRHALAKFDQMVVIAPDFAEGWNKRATVHYLLGNYAQSLADIAKTLALEPRHFGALAGRGLVYVQLEDEQGPVMSWWVAPGKLVVDSYKIPYPGLQFQVLKGTQSVEQLDGKNVTVFTTEAGKSYVEYLVTNEIPNEGSFTGNLGDLIQQEVLIIPDETFAGLPVAHIYQSAMIQADGPEMEILGNHINVYDESNDPGMPVDVTPPDLTIDTVELVYFVSNPYYQVNDPNYSLRSKYIQPVWRFHGRYEDGNEFDMLIQAQMVDLLRDLQKRRELTYMFISHDLRVVAALASRLVVMRDGKVVEAGAAADLFKSPKSAYTRALFAAAFNLDIAPDGAVAQ